MKGKDFDLFWKRNRKDLIRLIKDLKKGIGDEYRASEDDTIAGMQITISVNDDLTNWSYQTGDNSYSGRCYGDPYWGVGSIYRRSNSKEVADNLINDLENQIEFNCDDSEEVAARLGSLDSL